MKAKVFEARGGNVLDKKTPDSGKSEPLETALNQFLAKVKKVHFITQSECAVSHSFGSATRYTTVTVIYE
ncbi:MAG: hypothetical protein NTU62_10580 [Spirochaetes bacterium]|nr:hypothetical protein [Spirochaetota bacterium]